MSTPHPGRRLLGRGPAGGLLIAAAGVLVAVVRAGTDGFAATLLTAAFVLVAPAVAVAGPLRHVDVLGRTVVTLGAVFAVVTVVAQVMLSVDAWSMPGGVVAVGLISGALWTLLSGRGTAVSPTDATPSVTGQDVNAR